MDLNLDDLPGRLPQTRTRQGDPTRLYHFALDGTRCYRLQHWLEEASAQAQDYLTRREVILLAEVIREQIAVQNELPRPMPRERSKPSA
jgi:hypothetical protein